MTEKRYAVYISMLTKLLRKNAKVGKKCLFIAILCIYLARETIFVKNHAQQIRYEGSVS